MIEGPQSGIALLKGLWRFLASSNCFLAHLTEYTHQDSRHHFGRAALGLPLQPLWCDFGEEGKSAYCCNGLRCVF